MHRFSLFQSALVVLAVSVRGFDHSSLFTGDGIVQFHVRNGLYRQSRADIGEARETILKHAVSASTCVADKIISETLDHKNYWKIAPSNVERAINGYWFRGWFCGFYNNPPSGCSRPHLESDITCNSASQYRTVNGACNNLQRKLWGAAETPFKRFKGNYPAYEDGVNSPRGFGRSNNALPLPRDVSVAMSNNPSSGVNSPASLLLMQWGQFLDHDLVITPESRTLSSSSQLEEIECCDNGVLDEQESRDNSNCFPLDVRGDNFFDSNHGIKCRKFVRSLSTVTDCNLGPRQQLNLITSFVDASQVYGSSAEEEKAIRSFIDGRILSNGRSENGACRIANPLCFLPVHTTSSGSQSLFAGDERVEEQPGLTSMHTLFVRLHNYLAEQLKAKYQNQFSDEQIYQEVRRIVGAVIQRISYDEFLPIVLGSSAMSKYGLWVQSNGFISVYNSNIDPSAFNVFATAAFRFGHSLVKDVFTLRTTQVELEKNFNNPQATQTFGQYPSDFLEGMSKNDAEDQDHILVQALTNKLLATSPFNFGSDLYALNIQRGRDHGIHPYNFWRSQCGLSTFQNFDQMAGHLRPEAIRALKQAYRNRVEDVDLFPAGLAEIAQAGEGILGPTFTCIIGQQFQAIKQGDRFWFEGVSQPRTFSNDQLTAIRRTTLASLICQFTSTNSIQTSAMHKVNLPGNSNPLVACSSLSTIGNVVTTAQQFW